MQFISAALWPQSSEQMLQTYLIWLVVFMVINVIWDILSPNTPPFHVNRLKDKIGVVVGSTSFSSGILIFSSAFDATTKTVVGSSPAALVVAGAVSLLLSASFLCPYDNTHSTSDIKIGPPNKPSS